ncbi:MAG TPA: hypothetical protein VF059_01650 [Casimicrobiaceae bacterium]
MTCCRMCSQPLTRPGRLCRECESELDRERLAAASIGDLGASLLPLEASRPAEPGAQEGWQTRLWSRPLLVVGAFSIGLASAGTLYVAQRSLTPPGAESVMLDRDVSHVTPRLFAAGRDADAASTQPAEQPRGSARPRTVTLASASAADARHGLDRALALADALARCGAQRFFDRLACEQRARTRYCNGAGGGLPQCSDEAPRDRGK